LLLGEVVAFACQQAERRFKITEMSDVAISLVTSVLEIENPALLGTDPFAQGRDFLIQLF
jgi:hypothetical protein